MNLIVITERKQKELISDWIDTLEQNVYPQGTGKLNKLCKYCCLGVACEVFLKHFPGSLKITTDGSGTYQYEGNDAGLPDGVREAFGLRTSLGMYEHGTADQGGLYYDNDHHGKTFPEIAAIIKSRPKGLFIEPTPDAAPQST